MTAPRTAPAFTARGFTDEDLQVVTDLLNACDEVDQQDDNYTTEDLATEFNDPELDKTRSLRLWHDAEGRLAGFGQVWPRKNEQDSAFDGAAYMRVRPDVRDKGLEDEIIAWISERTREMAAAAGLRPRLRIGARDTLDYYRRAYERNGMSPVRYFFLMHRDLSEPIPQPQFPEGFTMIHSQGVGDAERWVEMFNLSFIDHWGHTPIKVESHEHWLSSPKYNPERDLVAVAPDGTWAAFCFCWIDPEDNERNNRLEGWIDILGTRRGFRKIGLGRAMLLAGLHSLKQDGMEMAKLGVDAENPTGALRLYESAGFYVKHTTVVYRKDL
jgi:mycothiol synthase